jgi:hypothetical protein
MKKRITRWVAALLAAVALGIAGWMATRPVVLATTIAVVPVGYPGAALQRLNPSGEIIMPGGSGGYLISMDRQNTVYCLGTRRKDKTTSAMEEVVIVTPPGGDGKVVLLPGSGTQDKKNGDTKNANKKNWNTVRRLTSEAFEVSPSGNRWWTVSRAYQSLDDVVCLCNIVRLYGADGRIIQEWSESDDDIGFVGVVGEDTFYLADEGNRLRIYKAGQKAPQEVSFSLSLGSVIDWQGNISLVTRMEQNKIGVVTVGSPLNQSQKLSRRYRDIPWPVYELKQDVSGIGFWHDPVHGSYVYEQTVTDAQTMKVASYAIHRVSDRGEVRTLMDIPTASLTEPGLQFPWCQFLKAEGDTVFAAVIRGYAPGSHRIYIAAFESVPRWKVWLTSRTSSGTSRIL